MRMSRRISHVLAFAAAALLLGVPAQAYYHYVHYGFGDLKPEYQSSEELLYGSR